VRSELLLFFAGLSAAGGAGACAGGVGVCVAPDMPSLKLRMPSPNPFMISGCAAAKENQDHSENYKPMKNTKFTHEPPPRAPLGSALTKP